MGRVYEKTWDEKGNCIFSREGYTGEAMCPTCGYPVSAVFWDDGEVQLDECPFCTTEEKEARRLRRCM